MKRKIKLVVMLVATILVLVPLSSATSTLTVMKKIHQTTTTLAQKQTAETTQVVCTIGNKKVVRELPIDTIQSLVDLGKTKRNDFLVIYNKYSTPEQVQKAFDDVQPFFNALINSGLTDKSIGDLNSLFSHVRDMIKKSKSNPLSDSPSGPQPLGLWNGLPTFIWANAACGIFTADAGVLGFTLGTNTLLPTIGIDALTAWFGSGETLSVGMTGVTNAAVFELGILLGFFGVMIATPLLIVGFLFQAGFAAVYIGVGGAIP